MSTTNQKALLALLVTLGVADLAVLNVLLVPRYVQERAVGAVAVSPDPPPGALASAAGSATPVKGMKVAGVKEAAPAGKTAAASAPASPVKAGPASEPVAASASPVKAEPATEPVATSEPEPKPEPKSEPKSEPKPASKPEPEPASKPEPEPASKPEPEPESEPEPEPESEPEPEPKGKPEPGLASPPVVPHLRFPTGSSEMDARSRSILARVARLMKERPALEVRAEGHADERGTPQLNLELSRERARNTAAALRELGVDPGRIQTRGYGEVRPLVRGNAPHAWAKNRRVELRWGGTHGAIGR